MKAGVDADIAMGRDLARMFAAFADELDRGGSDERRQRALREMIRQAHKAAFPRLTQNRARDLFLKLAMLDIETLQRRMGQLDESNFGARTIAVVRGRRDAHVPQTRESLLDQAVESTIIS